MPRYLVNGIRHSDGARETIAVNADDESAAFAQAKEKGIAPLKIQEDKWQVEDFANGWTASDTSKSSSGPGSSSAGYTLVVLGAIGAVYFGLFYDSRRRLQRWLAAKPLARLYCGPCGDGTWERACCDRQEGQKELADGMGSQEWNGIEAVTITQTGSPLTTSLFTCFVHCVDNHIGSKRSRCNVLAACFKAGCSW